MKLFWGAAQIAERLGYRSRRSFYLALHQGRVPAYRRRDPRNSRRIIWFSSESMILTGEMNMALQERDRVRAEREEKQRANAGR